MKPIIYGSILFLLTSFATGCSNSLKTVQQIDPNLPYNLTGKRIGISVSHLLRDKEGKWAYNFDNSSGIGAAQVWMGEGNITGKIIKVEESSILGEGHPLIKIYEDLCRNEKTVIESSPNAVKKILQENDIDCLLMYSTAIIGEVSTSSETNYMHLAEFAGRVGVSVLGGISGPSSNPNAAYTTITHENIPFRGVIYYACSSGHPLYVGGIEGIVNTSFNTKAFNALRQAAKSKE